MSGVSTMTEAKPTQAWMRSGRTPSICFIITAPSAPEKAPPATKRRPAESSNPDGSHMTRRTPATASAMPRPRRQRMRSPSIRIDSTVTIGTPS